MLVEGGFYFSEPNATPADWFMGISALAAGALLIIGWLTPIVGTVVAAGAVCVALSLLPGCMPNLFDTRISLIFALTMLATIVVLGPGAFSVDARLFGRREIIIPPRSSQPE